LNLHLQSEFLQAPDQAMGGLCAISPIEMVAPEVPVFDAVTEHVIDGNHQERGSLPPPSHDDGTPTPANTSKAHRIPGAS
jgi:hypothetical protein